MPPEGLDVGVRGEPMPWEEWDMTAPVVRRVLHFTSQGMAVESPAGDNEARGMWVRASPEG